MNPVDAEALNLPDYYDVIKQPVDLGTIKRKYDAKQYASVDEFRSDIILMCQNCFTYNPPDQLVHRLGKDLLVVLSVIKNEYTCRDYFII